jgi:sporulation protein YlmC with PRC-barrel domain
MNLYNENGDKLGDVKRVVQSPDANFHIVIGAGGFLGIRERDVRIPLERVTIRGSRLVIQGLTDDQVRIMPVFDRSDRTYRDLTRNTTVLITRDQSEN